MASPKSSSPAHQAQTLSRAVSRTVSEWRELRSALGLTSGASWSRVAETLGIDRGTAQRLVRSGRIEDVDEGALELLPGPRGWTKALEGASARLGSDHPAVERLGGAIADLTTSLAPWNGSKAAAVRAIQKDREPSRSRPTSNRRARAEWFRAASEVVGYSVDLRINLQLVRPSADRPGLLDIAMVNAFVGCRGRLGAMPLALTRFATLDGSEPTVGRRARSSERYRVLRSVGSDPPPTVLLSGDAERQTAFIEPHWSASERPLDVAVLQHEPASMPSPWTQDSGAGDTLVLSTLAKHPSRRQVNAALLAPELERCATVRFGAYRDLSTVGGQRNWFDRLPEDPDLTRGTGFHHLPVAEAHKLLVEVEQELSWGLTGFRSAHVDIAYPIPLARYSLELEVAAPDDAKP